MEVHCNACGRTYDGNAQCCYDMDHVRLPLPRQYAYNPQTNQQLGTLLQGSLWDYPGKTTLAEYATTLDWGVEASLIADSIHARPRVADQAILTLVMEYVDGWI